MSVRIGVFKKGNGVELGMMLKNSWMPIGVVLTAVLCMASEIYYSAEGTTWSIIQVFRSLLKGDAVEWEQLDMLVFLWRLPSSYLALFAPVLTALPCVLSFHVEKMNRYKRIDMFRRASSLEYYLRKWIAGVVTGGMILVLGIGLFQLSVSLWNVLFLHGVDGHKLILSHGVLPYLKYYGGAFLYGAMSSMLSILICFFSDNLYFIICIPFLLTYLYNTVISYLLPRLQGIGTGIYQKLAEYMGDLFSFSYIYTFQYAESVPLLLIRIVVVVLFVFGSLYIYDKYKVDCGE